MVTLAQDLVFMRRYADVQAGEGGKTFSSINVHCPGHIASLGLVHRQFVFSSFFLDDIPYISKGFDYAESQDHNLAEHPPNYGAENQNQYT